MIYVVCAGGSTGPGGICRMVDYFSTEWIKTQRQPSLRIVDSTGPYNDWRRQRARDLWRQPFYFISTFLVIFFAIIRRRICALHLHTSERGSVLRKALLVYLVTWSGIPVIIHMHAASFEEFYANTPRLGQRIITHAFRHCKRFIVLGHSFRKYFIETVNIDPDRIVVIPNGAPDVGSSLNLRLPHVPQFSNCELLFVGVLSARKGLNELLAALASSAMEPLTWHLRIVGDGNQTYWLNLIDRLNLTKRVTLLGWIDPKHVHGLMDEADVLVLPSYQEGLPMVIVEAMSHGRPVVATSAGSISDAVIHDVTGLLVASGNVDQLAAALSRLVADVDVRQRLGRAARQRYEEMFTIEQMTERLYNVIMETIKYR